MSQILAAGGTSIKTLQRGTIVLTGVSTNTATITSIDTTNATLRYLGNTTNNAGTQATARGIRVAVTNATTITATDNNNTVNYTTSYEITEYNAGYIKSVQRGTMTSSATATIASVDTTKTELSGLGYTYSGNNNDDVNRNYMVLTNATTVTATEANSTGGATLGYEAKECLQ